MAFWAPIVPIDGDCIPVLVLGLSPVDSVLPAPIPLELLPGLSDCCASTRGAATKTTARANMMVLLSLLVMVSSPFPTLQVAFISRHPGCTALRCASRTYRAFQETLL